MTKNIKENRRQRLLDRGLFSASDISGADQLLSSGTIFGVVIEDEIKLDINTDENSVILVIPYQITRNGMRGTYSRKITL